VLGRHFGPLYKLTADVVTGGSHWFKAVAIDELGNRKDSLAVSLTRSVDSTPPALPVFRLEGDVMAGQPVANHPFTVVVDVTDAQSGVEHAFLSRNGAVVAAIFDNGQLRFAEAAPAPGTVIDYVVTVADRAGNERAPFLQTLTARTDASPVITSVSVAGSIREQQQFTVAVSATDDVTVSKLRAKWQGQTYEVTKTGNSVSNTFTITDSRPRISGPVTGELVLEAEDEVHQVTTTTRNITVVVDNPPNAALNQYFVPASAFFSSTVHVSANPWGQTDDGGPLTVAIYDVTLPAPRQLYTHSSPSNFYTSQNLPTPGEQQGADFKLKFRVTDGVGQSSDSPVFTVKLTQVPNLVAFDNGGVSTVNPTSVKVGSSNFTLQARVLDSAARPVGLQTVDYRIIAGPVVPTTVNSPVTDASGYAAQSFSALRAAGTYRFEARLRSFPSVSTTFDVTLTAGDYDHVEASYVAAIEAGETANLRFAAADLFGNVIPESNEDLVTVDAAFANFHFGFADGVTISPLGAGERARLRTTAGVAQVVAAPAPVGGMLSLPVTTVVANKPIKYDSDGLPSTPSVAVTSIPIDVRSTGPSRAVLTLVSTTNVALGRPDVLEVGETARVRLELLDQYGNRVAHVRSGGGFVASSFSATLAFSNSARSNGQAQRALTVLQGAVEVDVTDGVAESSVVSITSLAIVPQGFDSSTTLTLDFQRLLPGVASSGFAVAVDTLRTPLNLTLSEAMVPQGGGAPFSVTLSGSSVVGAYSSSGSNATFVPEQDIALNTCYTADTGASNLRTVGDGRALRPQQVSVCSAQVGIQIPPHRYLVDGMSQSRPLRAGAGVTLAQVSNGSISLTHPAGTLAAALNPVTGAFTVPSLAGLAEGTELSLAVSGNYQSAGLRVANTLTAVALTRSGDFDADGISNELEITLALNPGSTDSDADGVNDVAEDSDNDGLANEQELLLATSLSNPDSDGDGLSDGAEVNTYGSNPKLVDSDGDGLSDGAEIQRGTNPALVDTDGDGLSDGAEVNTHATNPLAADTDADGLTDGAEINTHGTNAKAADTDGDGLGDGAEVNTHQTNPKLADTDGDNVPDGVELQTSNNPLDPAGLALGAFVTKLTVTPTVVELVHSTTTPAQLQLTVTATVRVNNVDYLINATPQNVGTAYSSSNAAAVTHESNGLFRSAGAGSASLSATLGSFSATSTVNVVLCGNGSIDAGEQCDDGNRADGDGCESTCQFDPGRVLSTIESGRDATCAISTTGAIKCWGVNDFSIVSGAPTTGTYKHVSVDGRACAIRSDDMVVCWGSGWSGSPPAVAVTSLSVGSQHGCVVRQDNSNVQCFGSSNGSIPAVRYSQVAVTASSTCAVREADGAIDCWGSSTNQYAGKPAATGFTKLASSLEHYCGVRNTGEVLCWGINTNGETNVPAGESFVGVAAGEFTSCGLRADGSVRCWGEGEPEERGTSGDLGQGTPRKEAADRFSELSAGNLHTCGKRRSGGIVCWGKATAVNPPLACANNVVEPWEACDDGNTSSGDGCNEKCTSREICGNGFVDFGEVCDDHGNLAGSYCGETCGSSTRCELPAGQTLATMCDDENECTAPSCDPQLGCGATLLADGTSCRAGAGTCRSGGCVVPQVAASYYNSCAITAAGKLSCWGNNSWGQLSEVPSGVFTKVALGGDIALCATKAPNDELICWGSPTWTEQAPVTNVTSFGLGYYHGCAIRKDTKAIQCWGITNGDGQLNAPANAPYVNLASTNYSSCAIRQDGAIDCWGMASQIVNKPTSGVFSKLASSSNNYCGLRADGAVQCWGNIAASEGIPPTGELFVDLVMGEAHACGLRADGSVRCWGEGEPEEQGDSSDQGQATPPSSPLDYFTSIGAGPGGQHTCGVRRSGTVVCWGQNGNAQSTVPGSCGNGVLEPSEACDDGNRVSGDGCEKDCKSRETCGNGFVDIDVGELCDDNDDRAGSYCSSTCTVSTRCDAPAGGSLATLCDDENECTAPICDPQTGCGAVTVADGTSCSAGAGTCRSGGCVIPQVATTWDSTCAIGPTGNLKCWGDNTWGQVGEAPQTGVFTKVWMGGDAAACATRAPNDQLVCWGYPTWTEQAPTTNVAAFTGGYYHGCIVRKDTKAVQCWGITNSDGQLNTPTNGPYIAVGSSDYSSCAIRQNGAIDCWGMPSRLVGKPTSGAFTQIAGSRDSYCALRSDGVAQCFGVNDAGETVPPAGELFVDLAVGEYHSCGLRADGSVKCWGDGELEERGNSTDLGQSTPPTTPLDYFTSIVSGYESYHTCGIRRGGGIACWGKNNASQSTPPGACGNGIVDPVEACDDGNRVSADGCEKDCKSRETCGNGFVDTALGEVCDDNEDRAGNFCSATCAASARCEPPVGQSVETLCDDANECTASVCDPQLGCAQVNVAEGTACGAGAGTCRSGGCVVPQVASAWDNTCTLGPAGNLKCWGDTSYSIVSETPASGVFTSVWIGGYHVACATKAPTDQLTCWGYPTWSEEAPAASTRSYSGGEQHGCLVRKDTGALQCWGSNNEGQLNAPSNGPYVSVASSDYSNCAIRQNGAIDCWGMASRLVGKPTTGVFTQIAGSRDSYCALRSDGVAQCFGVNDAGETVPPAGELFVSLAVGEYHSCGLRANGSVKCWGDGELEERGDGTDLGQSTPPTTPQDYFTSISSGYDGYHTCGLRRSGGVVCWGKNNVGQATASGTCGNGIVDPVEACDDGNRVSADGCEKDCKSRETCGNGFADTALGEVCDDNEDRAGNFCSATCAASTRCEPPVGQSLETFCSDDNECTAPTCDAQLGCGQVNVADGISCKAGAGTCRSGGCVVPQVASAWDNTCSIGPAGNLKCWGDTSYGILNEAPTSGVFTSVWMGGYHVACATRAPNDQLICWGYATWNEEAPATSTRSYGGGELHGCLVRKDTGALQCWGSNAEGQLNAPNNGPYASVTSGDYSNCAVRKTGEIDCWGLTTRYAGKPTTGVFKKVASADDNYCALRNDGVVLCFGVNNRGETVAPVGEVFVDVTVGEYHACGLRADGSVKCWGDGEPEERGDWTDYGQSAPPTSPQDYFTSISSGYEGYHTCGVRRSGGVVCWGKNTAGQATATGTCGNSIVDPVEACDDGNRFSGDGCEKDCKSRETCGNGFVDTELGEACDDSDDRAGSYCSPTCALSSRCTPPAGQTLVELCDDENECTAPACDQQLGCLTVPVADGTTCGGGGTCRSGGCVVPQLTASWDNACFVSAVGKLTCWGDSSYGLVGETPSSGVFTKIWSGGYHTACGVRAPAGQVSCWGYQTWTEQVPATNVIDVSGGDSHGCLIRKDTKALQCWGSNADGQLDAPVAGPYVGVASVDRASCALRQTGEMDCWGLASRLVNKPISGTFKKVVGIDTHFCAVKSDGEVLCWGVAGSYGLTTNPYSAERFVDVAVSNYQNCALLADGRARCWGNTVYGGTAPPLGNADLWSSLVVGNDFGCGIRRGGGVGCWGRNSSGQATPPGTPATCGNNPTIDPIEACEKNIPGSPCNDTCSSNLQCGNGIVDAGEACDDGTGGHRDTCDDTCQHTWSSLPFPAPVTHINFDESARYLSTYGNLGTGAQATATIHGSGVVPSQPSQTISSSALFSGSSDDYISLANTVDKPSSLTVSVWVKQIAPANGTSSIAYHRAEPGALVGWSFTPAASEGGDITFRAGNAATGISSSVSAGGFALGVWTHLVATYDQSSNLLDLYIDGELAASTVASGFSGIGHLASTMKLGEGLSGYLDEFSVWNNALDGAQIAQLYDYGRQGKAVRSQWASQYVSPCAKELQRNPSATNGVYNFAVGSDAESPIPVYCDMTDGGWTLVFKKSAGVTGGVGAESLWFGAPTNELDITLMSRAKSTKDYSSRLAGMLKYFADMRVEVATGGVVQKNVVFDAIEASRGSWFTSSRVKSSSWTDLPPQNNWDLSLEGRHFSIYGSGGRDFYIHNNWGGCSADQGWMMFSNASSCSFDGGTTGKILYASGATKQISSSMAQAETLMVFGR
jgi:cysteine-rich repeat protein